MIIDLRKIAREGKESEEFSFDYTPERNLAEGQCYVVDCPIKVCGTVTLTGKHSALIDGEAEFSLSGECTRCLCETTRGYGVEFHETASTDDENAYPVVCDKVDISKIADDVIIMNLPVSFLCKSDCKGICAGCGVNLNESSCKCENKGR